MSDRHPQTPPAVLKEQSTRGGRYYIPLDGTRVTAELTWRRNPDGSITADHTYVPDEWRGQGLAHRLVDALMQDAQTLGWQVIPVCSYVRAASRRNPDWQALTANRPV